MDFHKLTLDFCNEIGQEHFGLYLKNKVFRWQNFLEKKQENPNFGPLCRNVNLPLRLNCISFCRLKILSHIQKNFEMSNVEILRKVVNRQTYGQTIHL